MSEFLDLNEDENQSQTFTNLALALSGISLFITFFIFLPFYGGFNDSCFGGPPRLYSSIVDTMTCASMLFLSLSYNKKEKTGNKKKLATFTSLLANLIFLVYIFF